ncbi:SDR family oxidoreductase [Hyalangium versicolor]|uniref:SDR family oxidoreductase n=1 Tax=Hyalangium versicolor TaxID=2861190 RepID=UPI001CCEC17E|nr:SDR family oxidoreductase [Hyalangium versicolor]
MSDKKVAFITGGNRGLGLETAKQLGQLGIFPVIGSRNLEQGRVAVALLRAEGIEADAIQFDVVDKEHYRAAYEYFEQRFGKLDILINNAGVSLEGEPADAPARKDPTSSLTEDALRGTMEANFFGVVLSTQVLLPLIRKSPAGRIVNLSSNLGSLTWHSDPTSRIYPVKMFAYDTSKAALNSFTIHLAHELRNTPIKVNSVHPGWVHTQLGGKVAPTTPEEGAKTSVRLATLPADGPTGGYFHQDQHLPW